MFPITPFLMIIIASLLSYPLGKWMATLLDNKRGANQKLSGKSSSAVNQDWKSYSLSLLIFNLCSFVFVWVILSLQQILPLNPDRLGRISPSLIFHTVASFVANTNQQHYSGESTMSYASQIFGLMWLQFVSAGTGIAAMLAASRALAGRTGMGNFHVDLRRTVLYVLLPLALIEAILLLIAGVPMTFHGSAHTSTLEGIAQTIARGPVAAFVALNSLGQMGVASLVPILLILLKIPISSQTGLSAFPLSSCRWHVSGYSDALRDV